MAACVPPQAAALISCFHSNDEVKGKMEGKLFWHIYTFSQCAKKTFIFLPFIVANVPKGGIFKNTVTACFDRRVAEHVLYYGFGKIFLVHNVLISKVGKDSLNIAIYWGYEKSGKTIKGLLLKWKPALKQHFALVTFLFSLCPGQNLIFMMTGESNREHAY